MFGTNERVGRKFFAEADGRYLVTSQFFTLQGEGPYAGMPAIFTRLAKCNLACDFCDTYFDGGRWMTNTEMAIEESKLLLDFFNCDIPEWAQLKLDKGMCWDLDGTLHDYWTAGEPLPIVYVITGGEPTLQKIAPLIESRERLYRHVQIESNGLVACHLPFRTTLVISPKAVGKPLHYPPPNRTMLEMASCLKFVIEAPREGVTSPYTEVPEWALAWRERTGLPIFVSPMNIYLRQPTPGEERVSFWEPGLLDVKRNQANHEYAADYVMRHGLRLNLQSHLYASLP